MLKCAAAITPMPPCHLEPTFTTPPPSQCFVHSNGLFGCVAPLDSGGAWILLAALPAVLLGGAKPNVGRKSDRERSRPPKTVQQRKPSTTASPKGWSSKPSTVVKKESAMPRAGKSGGGTSLARALVPENVRRLDDRAQASRFLDQNIA